MVNLRKTDYESIVRSKIQPLKLKERIIMCMERDGNHFGELEQQRD